VLVLLDNCEHLLASCARLAETLLAAGPEVRVLATSREALGVEGEVVYQVHPLPTPPGDEAPDVLAAYDSVRLFADRAGLAARGFAITAENATTVSSICRRLDGLPLAIELAAARMSALAPEDVADRLDNRFRLLARSQPTVPPRHQTLEATVAWSYDHLTEAQRTLFVRLAVFSGPFGLDMAEAICPDLALSRDDVAPLLSDLVQRSLVGTFDTPRGRRYRLLETLRAYARAKLERARAAAQVWQRHRDYFLRSAEERIPGLEAAAWFESVEPQHEDMEAALSWSLRAGDAREAALLASALGQFWRHVGHPRRAVTRLRETLDRLDLHAEPEREADLRCVLSDALFEAADGDAAFAEAERAYALVSAQPPSPEKLVALWTYAGLFLLVVHRDPTQAVAPAREMLAVALALGDRRAEVAAHHALGHALGWSGSIDEGLEHTRRALAIAQELGSPQLILTSYASFMTPLMLHPEARREEPRRITEEILSQFGQDERWDEYIPWTWICYVFLETGEWDRAEEVIDRWEHRHLEGFALSILYHARGCLRWMQGRLADAEADMAAADTPDLAQRMYHDVFNLRADVAADAGQLEQVRNIVARYMAAGVHAAEEFMKTAVLCALVRAEVDAALGRGGAPHDDHAQRARDAFGQMQEILRRYPPPTGGSVQLETPATHLLMAEAELSRLANPRPELWRALIEQASYAYWKLYARWRLAESLVATGRRTSAGRELHAAGAEAGRLGASLLRAHIAATAAQAGLRVPA
jgi:predicted ATPase